MRTYGHVWRPRLDLLALRRTEEQLVALGSSRAWHKLSLDLRTGSGITLQQPHCLCHLIGCSGSCLGDDPLLFAKIFDGEPILLSFDLRPSEGLVDCSLFGLSVEELVSGLRTVASLDKLAVSLFRAWRLGFGRFATLIEVGRLVGVMESPFGKL